LADDTVCANANGGTLSLNKRYGDVVQWESNTDSVWYPLTNVDTFYTYSNLTKTTSYRVLVKNGTCAVTYSDTATITVYLPQIKIIPLGNILFCKGDSVNLMASSGYSNYQWNSGESVQSIKVFQEGQYKVTIADTNNCKNSDSIRITVYSLPIAYAGMDATISLGASTLLKGKGGVKYLWQPGETLNDSTISEPLASPLSTTTYRLLVTDTNQCLDTDEVKITVVMDYNIYANNIITPNGDGVNDTWKIKNILPYEKSTVTIVNRYGYIVYEKTGYDNSWNGTVDGERVSDGTYYYIVTFDDNAKIVKGHITILSK
jgi:gliding motility-associated-like protein